MRSANFQGYVYACIIRNIIKLPCYCATLRQAARVISQKYDAALRDSQLTLTQFTLLTALGELPQARVNDLAEALGMDQTTVSRTLQGMERAQLIDRVAAPDRRESRWTLTAQGRERRRRALPHWKAAQKGIERALGAEGAQRLAAAAFELAGRLADEPPDMAAPSH
jgi:DNA-binding MarR family transcriptional regulator